MRTEIVNLIKNLWVGDQVEANKHLEVLKENFKKMDKMHDDYRFVKRILAIFFPNNTEYQSEPVEIDPLERITTEPGVYPKKVF